MNAYGGNTNTGTLQKVLVKHPHQAYGSQEAIQRQWQALNYLQATDYGKALQEYEGLLELLKQFSIELHFLPEDPATGLDSIYAHDPLFVFNGGAVALNMGKDQRRGEPGAAAAFMQQIGIPLCGRITDPGTVEGGDFFWLDGRTIAIGEGYRTNAEGIRQLRALLGDAVDEVVSVPLVHWTGPADCLHLLSFISPLDTDLAVVYSRMMPVFFRRMLLERGYQLVEVPDEEYERMACNVLAVAPRKAIVIDGSPVTRSRLEKAGVEVWAYQGEHISLNGGGGPTCLTRPLLRAA